MSDIAIRVEHVGKRYRIGATEQAMRRYHSLHHAVRWRLDFLRQRLTNALRGEAPPTLPTPPDEFWALKEVSFTVYRGDAVGIVGKNGSGKSTLLKIASRITEPTTGYLDVTGRISSLLEVGTGFHPELTGRENIFLNGAILGMKKAEISRKFDEIVAFSEIEQFIDTPVKHYSSGMYVRLAFSVAAHLEPDILILDEVLAVGDAAFQKKCLAKMNQVSGEGRTLLFVSHNMAAVKALCNRAILLHKGKMVLAGSTDDVAEYYSAMDTETVNQQAAVPVMRSGNGTVRILGISLVDHDGQETTAFATGHGARLRIQYEILADGSSACFGIVLSAIDGGAVLSTINTNEPNYFDKPMPAGQYSTSCVIPAHLLNVGTYALSLGVYGANWEEPVYLNTVLVFQATEDGILRRNYTGGFMGNIRPMLDWQTAPIADPAVR